MDIMLSTVSDVWCQVLSKAKEELDNPNYDYLLEGTRALHSDNSTFVVGVPSQFARDWLEVRLLPELEELLYETSGRVWRLNLVVGTNAIDSLPISPPEPKNEVPGQQSLSFSAPEPARPARAGELVRSILNPRYTFDSFVVGSGNRFAYAACMAIGEEPGQVYNPLFLYGGVGLGKTHLMHAIGQYAKENHGGLHVVYVSCERFTNDMVNALMQKSMPQFRSRYRQADILLIDDIQFLAGKEQTQEEIFHTFNSLHEAGKQIVVSSDRPPKEIPTLEDRLRSRFEWGLTADIQAPDLETRIAILRKKAETEHYIAPNDVFTYIAKHVYSNIRELEGALIRVMAYSELHKRPINCDLAAEALKDIIQATSVHQLTIPYIQEVVATYFNIKVNDMRSKKRTQDLAFPRQIAMYLTRELTDFSLPRIGAEFGGKHHTSVMHACTKINNEILSNPSFASTINDLKSRLQNP